MHNGSLYLKSTRNYLRLKQIAFDILQKSISLIKSDAQNLTVHEHIQHSLSTNGCTMYQHCLLQTTAQRFVVFKIPPKYKLETVRVSIGRQEHHNLCFHKQSVQSIQSSVSTFIIVAHYISTNSVCEQLHYVPPLSNAQWFFIPEVHQKLLKTQKLAFYILQKSISLIKSDAQNLTIHEHIHHSLSVNSRTTYHHCLTHGGFLYLKSTRNYSRLKKVAFYILQKSISLIKSDAKNQTIRGQIHHSLIVNSCTTHCQNSL